MDPQIIKYGILALAAALSGFFLVGFIIYTVYAGVMWFKVKKEKTKIWGGLIGVGLNGLVFILTFPVIFPLAWESLNKVLGMIKP